MEWLFNRFLYAIKDIYKNVDPYEDKLQKLCESYGKLAEIHIKNKCDYGDVFTNEDFAHMIDSGFIISTDGIGYYVGTDLIETEEYVDFNANTIRSKADIYPYIFWYNK